MSKWRRLGWRYRKITHRAWRKFCGLVYRDRYPDLQRTALVAGTARSGTTWLGDLIASQAANRMMFEPFNPKLIKEYRQFNYFQYVRPEEENEPLEDYCLCLFSGKIRHHWIDKEVSQLFPDYRVVKAVRANLILKWLARQFPDVPQVLIIRHPCAVVLSRMRLDWATDTDIEAFLEQPALVDDFIADKIDLIQQCSTEEEKHAIIWCVSNLVPLQQFQPGEIHVVFYENLNTQPEIEVPRLFKAIGRAYDDSIYLHLDKPSITSHNDSAVVSGNAIFDQWRQKLSPTQVDRILAVVEAFGLDYLYGDSLFPGTMLHNIAG